MKCQALTKRGDACRRRKTTTVVVKDGDGYLAAVSLCGLHANVCRFGDGIMTKSSGIKLRSLASLRRGRTMASKNG